MENLALIFVLLGIILSFLGCYQICEKIKDVENVKLFIGTVVGFLMLIIGLIILI